MTWGRSSSAAAATACAAVALAGALVPSTAWLHAARGSSAVLTPTLLTGALLLRVLLIVLGVFMFVGLRRGWWSAGSSGASRTIGPRDTWLAVAMLAIGVPLRLYALGRGLWADEVWTLLDYVRPPLGTILTTYESQNQHFLFSILAHISVSAFGESAWSLRLPAALFGIATLWAFWRFALQLTDVREALLSMAVLTFSYQHIWFSQNARGYSALLFWTIVSSHFLVRALRERTPRLWGWYAISTALGMYTHMTMAFVVAGQFVVYAWSAARERGTTPRERLIPFWSGFVLAGLLTLVCYAIVLPQIPGAAAADLSNVTEWRSPLWMISEMGRELNAGAPVLLVAIVGLGIVAAGLVSYARESAIVPLLFLVPTITGAASMVALSHHLWPRFFFFAAGFGILIVVRGLTAVVTLMGTALRLNSTRVRLLATAATLLMVLVLGRSLEYVYRPKQDYAGARDFVEASRRPGDGVVAVGVAREPFVRYFAPQWSTATTLEELNAIRASHTRTWLVYTLPIEMENTFPDIYRSAQREFRLVKTFDGSLGDGTMYVSLAGGSPEVRTASDGGR